MKIRHYLLIALFLIPSLSRAAGINIELQDAKLPDIIQLFMKSIFKAEYVLSPDIKSEQKTMTVSLKNKTPEQAKSFFITVLQDYKIHIENKGGIFFIKKDVANSPVFKPVEAPEQQAQSQPQLESNTDQIKAIDLTHEQTLPEPESPPVDLTDLVKLINDDKISFYEPKNTSPESIQQLLTFAGIHAQLINGKLLFKIPPDKEEYITNLIADFDHTKPDLVIKASLYEYTKRDNKQNAVEAVLNILKDTLTITLPTVNIASATRLAINAKDVPLLFKVLNTQENFKVLSSPTIRATDDKQASINIGASVPVLNQIVTNATGQIQQSVQYRDSGITLQVTPKIRRENIELNIMQNVSDFTLTTTGVNQSPTLIQRRLETTLNCKDGDLILLGGLEQSRDEKGRSSFLGLPTGNRASKENTDLLLVLHVTKI
ncbi:hypothetical protein [Methylophilus sp.]|uniref:type II secretion system protein GspD n=1 Tax=Methylophilus sp. TaxID=29541 RepID=UPI00257EC2A3|nr:hypothetical protein [Methylophilus sp.]